MRTRSLRCWQALTLWAFCTWVPIAEAADLRVMKTGLGEGTISAPGISCGTTGTDCNETGLSGNVTLRVTVPMGSELRAWGGDCASVVVTPPATPPPCTIEMSGGGIRSVRADIRLTTPIPTITDFSPGGLETYLNANPTVDTTAEFVAALPQDFRENWLLMVRSESLQTGTAKFPRILLVSADATRVFTIALDTHTSYPGAHPSAIEYMQWNAVDKNFHFHEIVLRTIPDMDQIDPGPPAVFRFPERPRGTDPVKEDDPKCFSCHSTRNVRHDGVSSTPGTTGIPIGSVPWKNKPNWDTYDSWGGMLAFNRDRIYQGTVEAAAFRKTFNLWTWQNNDAVRAVIEQLKLQPDGVLPNDRIVRWDTPPLAGGANDGHIEFDFDPDPPAVDPEPQPAGTGLNVLYNFDRRVGPANPANVLRADAFVTLRHSCQPRHAQGEGRAVEFFDRLTGGRPPTDPGPTDPFNPACPPRPVSPPQGGPNALRIADELISHQYATGNVRIDVRPIALAIARGCITVVGGSDITATQTVSGAAVSPAAIAFLDIRNGLTFDQVHDDTRRREQSLTRRKADIARTTFDRDTDLYVYDPNPFDSIPIADTPDLVKGMIREFGAGTLGILGGTGATDSSLQRLRQEVFRRAPPPGHADETVMGGFYVDREDDSTPGSTGDHTGLVALYRYFLEPLGVSVDKWSMGVRGRSRTYTFADIFGSYTSTFQTVLSASLGVPAGTTCTTQISDLATTELNRLAMFPETPTYTDIQRIFNKSCIECHDASIGYPPYRTYAEFSRVDLSENENPAPGERRLWRSLDFARRNTSAPVCELATPVCAVGTGTDVRNSYLYRRITDDGQLQHPYNPGQPHDFANPDNPMNPDVADERCPGGLMPCEGPPLSKVDIESFRRWIIGGRPNTEGDPHLRTIDGVHYDFQSAGEFILLRGEGLELQARQTAVTTAAPVGPDRHTGLTSCVSVNTAVAIRAGLDRVTYQPEIVAQRPTEGMPKQRRLVLRVNRREVRLGPDGIALPSGGRIISTSVPNGIEVLIPGGEAVVVTPALWEYYQIWHMNIEVRHARSTEGVMGAIAPGSWLPALSTGASLGVQSGDLSQRFRDLYETFANSWRVDAGSSLFDYEAGLSPASFVVAGWPVSGTQGCVAPPQPGGPLQRPAPAPIARAEAQRLCRDIVAPARRDNCVADVMATGEAGFAAAYKNTEALERRRMPAPPVLVSPPDNARVPGNRVDFVWAPHPGTEGIDVVYRHCIWHADQVYDFNRCIKLPGGSDTRFGSLVLKLQKRLWLVILIAILLLLAIAVLLTRRYGKWGLVIALLLAAIVAVLLFALAQVRVGTPLKTSVTDLVPGKVYFWKVVAETKDGVTVESQTYRLEVAP